MSDSRIVDELKRIVNSKDGYKNTPLHYATQLWPQEVVRKPFHVRNLIFLHLIGTIFK
jgi:hypothetical protein